MLSPFPPLVHPSDARSPSRHPAPRHHPPPGEAPLITQPHAFLDGHEVSLFQLSSSHHVLGLATRARLPPLLREPRIELGGLLGPLLDQRAVATCRRLPIAFDREAPLVTELPEIEGRVER